MKEPLVSISCITFNHENYIRDALEGFLMQKTDFDFEILIHDDASTDGTQKIIEEYAGKYPEIIKPILETENQYVKGRRGSLVFNIPRAKGRYIAFCEGDDYWTDPRKLQKQVDFLEKNKDFIACVHRVKIMAEEGRTVDDEYISPPDIIRTKDLYTGWLFHINSLLVRNIREEFVQWSSSMYIDTAFSIMISQYGKIKGLPDVMSVYRKHTSGLSGSQENMATRLEKELKIIKAIKKELGRKFFLGNLYLSAKQHERFALISPEIYKHPLLIKIKYFIILTILTGIMFPHRLRNRGYVLKIILKGERRNWY